MKLFDLNHTYFKIEKLIFFKYKYMFTLCFLFLNPGWIFLFVLHYKYVI